MTWLGLSKGTGKVTANWGVKFNHGSYGTCKTASPIKFKTSMIRSRLCDYIDAYILPKGTITVENRGTAAAQNNRNKKVIFKNCGPFTDCKSEINNKEIDHAKDNEVVTPMHNLLEYSDKYPNKSRSF